MAYRSASVPVRLLQREHELGQLRGALDAAAQGRGSLTLVTGAAGTGKSSLLAAADADSGAVTVRRARGTELEHDFPFGVVRQLLEVPLQSLAPAERDRCLSGAASSAKRIFESAPQSRGADDGGFATLHGLYWLVANLAASRPLALVVDDAQWSDAPSLRALAYLAGRLDDLALALVVCVRSGETTPVADLLAALQSHPETHRLELGELDGQTVAALVREFLPRASDELCAAFHESSGGNPLYVRELLRSVDGGGDGPSASDVRDAALSSVGDRVQRRLEAVGPEAPLLAAAMAVLGMSGRLPLAAALAQLDETLSASLAERLRRAEILAYADPFEWIHPLVQRSLYDTLTVTRRDELHARAADLLEEGGAAPGHVAAHLAALRPTGSSRVTAALVRAAEEAIARDAPGEAGALVRRALAEGAAEPSRGELLLRLGQIDVGRRDPSAAAHLREALELLDDPKDRALAALSLGEILTHAGDWESAARVIDEARNELGPSDPELQLELDVTHALVCAFDPVLASTYWSERERLVGLTGGDSWAAHALCALLASTSGFRGEYLDEVLPLAERAVEGDVLFSQRAAGAWTPAHALAGFVLLERYERAAEVADDIAVAARMQGSIASAVVADATRGWSTARLGDLAAAEEMLRPLQDFALQNGLLLLVANLMWFGADVMLERPSQTDVAQALESLQLPPAFEEAAGGAWVKSARGRLRTTRGDRVGAEQDLRAAGSILERLGFGPLHDPWRSWLALALPRADADEALALVESEFAEAEATGLSRPRGIVLRAKGLLARGDEAVELLRDSVAVLRDSPARYEHAQSLVALGAALRRGGWRADARTPLAEGRELAYRCGAERLSDQAREELVATGARPRRIARSGFDALTASERRVTRLAAQERSNADIAQDLYLSVKTVERHLSSAYAKLDITGPGARRRLAGVIPTASPDH
ncbi:MAG TPA: AAA family ATPase [Solirubrobacteraceae bacterium]|jgi:DNA-binding CsgD family transcriptional regulator